MTATFLPLLCWTFSFGRTLSGILFSETQSVSRSNGFQKQRIPEALLRPVALTGRGGKHRPWGNRLQPAPRTSASYRRIVPRGRRKRQNAESKDAMPAEHGVRLAAACWWESRAAIGTLGNNRKAFSSSNLPFPNPPLPNPLPLAGEGKVRGNQQRSYFSVAAKEVATVNLD